MTRLGLAICCLACALVMLIIAGIYGKQLNLATDAVLDQENQLKYLQKEIFTLRKEYVSIAIKLNGYQIMEAVNTADEKRYYAGEDQNLIALSRNIVIAEKQPKELAHAVFYYAINVENKRYLKDDGVSENYSSRYLVPKRFCNKWYSFRFEELYFAQTGRQTIVRVALMTYDHSGHRTIKPVIIYCDK